MAEYPRSARPELFSALPWLAAAVPVATNLSVMVGALEGRERFLAVNSLQVFSAAAFQLFPLAVAYWHGPNLKWLVGAAVLARLVSSLPLFFACRKVVPLTRGASVQLGQEPGSIFLRQLDHRVRLAYTLNGDS